MFIKGDTPGIKAFIVELLKSKFPDMASVLDKNVQVGNKCVNFKKGLLTARIGVSCTPTGKVVLDLDKVTAGGLGGFGLGRKLAGNMIIKKLKAYPVLFESVEKKEGNIHIKVKYVKFHFIDLLPSEINTSLDLCIDTRQ